MDENWFEKHILIGTNTLNVRLISVPKSLIILLLACFAFGDCVSQNLNPEDNDLYRDDLVPRVDVFVAPDTLSYILDPANSSSDLEFRSTCVFQSVGVNDTIEEVGFRLRGNTSRASRKKSFKLSFNTYQRGRKYKGVEKVNLNGEHNDPSISRAKLAWQLAEDLGLPAARANHVQLYINDAYFGLYANVEHIDEEFAGKRFGNENGNLYKCTYPADLDFISGNPNDYKVAPWGRRTYELKTNLAADDYSDLAQFIHVLNNTGSNIFECELEKVFNVQNYLKAVVLDVLSGNWDGPLYNMNNFYLYKNTFTNQFEYIPFDLDNTFGVDFLNRDWGTRDINSWSRTGATRPLYTQIMARPKYKAWFNFYMKQSLDSIFTVAKYTPILNSLRTQLLPYAQLDTYRSLDYGFTNQDFIDAFGSGQFGHVDYGLADFVQTRSNSARSQMSLSNVAPIVYNLQSDFPTAGQPLIITVRVDDEAQPNVTLRYTLNGGAFLQVPMLDDGVYPDELAGDKLYTGQTQALAATPSEVVYYVMASDNSGNQIRYPNCTEREIVVGQPVPNLRINEIMSANNLVWITDPSGKKEDWVELYNGSSGPVNLFQMNLTNKRSNRSKWELPAFTLGPNDYILIWLDDDNFEGPTHANFQLNRTDAWIGVYDKRTLSYSLIDSVKIPYSDGMSSFGRYPNGVGSFQNLYPTPSGSNLISNLVNPRQKTALFELHGNPLTAGSILTVKEHAGEILHLKWYDTKGQLVQNQSIPIQDDIARVELNLEVGLSRGNFLLEVESSKAKWAVLVLK